MEVRILCLSKDYYRCATLPHFASSSSMSSAHWKEGKGLEEATMNVIWYAYTETACLLMSFVLHYTLGEFTDFIRDNEGILIGEHILVEGFLVQQ